MTEFILEALADPQAVADDTVALPFHLRQRARLRITLRSGREAGIKLPRGTVLRGGDVLVSRGGEQVRILAAPETVSTVRCLDPAALARAAYHLGNRHVWVQVGDGWLRYLHDHVLDDMVGGLGLAVAVEEAPFEPEGGAYSGGHGHTHTHGHPHGHEHDRGQPPGHCNGDTHAHGDDHGQVHGQCGNHDRVGAAGISDPS